MVSKWNTSGSPVPTSETNYADHITDLDDAIDTALSCDSGTSDPSSGAPTAWGVTEIGRLWFDRTNEVGAGGDDLGATTKRWEKVGATPTYQIRTLNLRGFVAKAPTVSLVSATATSQTAWVDVTVGGATTSSRALAVELYVEVSESNPAAGIFAAFRKKGVTTDPHPVKVYPQVATLTNTAMIRIELDTAQTFQYQYIASGNTSANINIDVAGYWERI